jgi:hypothetical protein
VCAPAHEGFALVCARACHLLRHAFGSGAFSGLFVFLHLHKETWHFRKSNPTAASKETDRCRKLTLIQHATISTLNFSQSTPPQIISNGR